MPNIFMFSAKGDKTLWGNLLILNHTDVIYFI